MSEGMKIGGWFTIAASVMVGLVVCSMQTTTGGGYGEASVHNIGLMQNRDLTALLAATLFLAGVAMLVGGGIIAAIAGQSAPPASVEKAAAESVYVPAPPVILTDEEVQAQKAKTLRDTLYLVAGVVAIIGLVLALAISQTPKSAPTLPVTENSAEELADRILAEADNAAAPSSSDTDNPFK